MNDASPFESLSPRSGAPTSRASLAAGRESGDGVISRLKAAGLLLKRSRGQHFLHDPVLLDALVEAAGLTEGARVFEVGTGPATLTRPLAARAGRVLSVDVDARLLEFARSELVGFSNLELLCVDVLGGAGGELHAEVLSRLEGFDEFDWVSNLPYGIASPLIVRFLASGLRWRRATLLVQLEVAERLVAAGMPPAERRSRRDYGPLSLLVGYWARARILRRVKPGSFWPPPRVDSALVQLEPLPGCRPVSFERFRSCVDRIFQQRRKQLGTLLRGVVSADGFLEALPGVPLTARPEELSLDQVLRLAAHF